MLDSIEAVTAQPPEEQPRQETSFAQKCRVEAEKYRVTPRLVQKHTEAFQLLWSQGMPVSVDPPQGINFDPYSPANLDILHGTEETVASKCDFSPWSPRIWKHKSITVRKFLQTLSASKLGDYLAVKAQVCSPVQ